MTDPVDYTSKGRTRVVLEDGRYWHVAKLSRAIISANAKSKYDVETICLDAVLIGHCDSEASTSINMNDAQR